MKAVESGRIHKSSVLDDRFMNQLFTFLNLNLWGFEVFDRKLYFSDLSNKNISILKDIFHLFSDIFLDLFDFKLFSFSTDSAQSAFKQQLLSKAI